MVTFLPQPRCLSCIDKSWQIDSILSTCHKHRIDCIPLAMVNYFFAAPPIGAWPCHLCGRYDKYKQQYDPYHELKIASSFLLALQSKLDVLIEHFCHLTLWLINGS